MLQSKIKTCNLYKEMYGGWAVCVPVKHLLEKFVNPIFIFPYIQYMLKNSVKLHIFATDPVFFFISQHLQIF